MNSSADTRSTGQGKLRICGHDPESVLDLLRDRIANPRGGKDDGRRLSLVVEGGGMRGVVSAGVLSALDLAGGGGVFWKAYASSAGAINTAHFLSRNGVRRADTYHRYLASRRFFNPLRFRRVVDTNYVIDEVLKRDNPLDVEGCLASPTKLVVPLFCYDRAETVHYPLEGSAADVFELLRAAVAIPVVSGPLPSFRGDRMCDGGLECPVPVRQAISDGATDLIVILSHDPWLDRPPPTMMQKLLYRFFFARGRKDLLQVFASRPARAFEQSRICRGDAAAAGSPRILCFCPASPVVGALSIDPSQLREALLSYTRETLSLLGRADLLEKVDELASPGNPWEVPPNGR